MKNCWNCAEEIQDEARTCRFCGAEQANARPDWMPSWVQWQPRVAGAGQKAGPNSFQSCMGCLGTIIVILILVAMFA